ncbi:hypothetical protein H257_08000 [Aphanomyces astaci]|uniref:Uncharacterized protein n=1 Tax=Aphanomyces astaci TaxID=112090 RepID=W4GFK9_APHAT|nr:hypothetical protein H257_08000 [Aphanomyces astaci]ETV78477.1 hypothetical protein H257_08000 [Aphanomyces astaci]|eukprot:XP_009832058.1 hypothetical protein H257_08000 [Aphanomyces astaci]
MKPKRFRKQVPRTYLWCDDSVEKMFMLRYTSALAPRFESKNNYGKGVAYVMLATELSVSMEREFTAKQVQDKAVDSSFVADDDDAKEIKIEMAEEPSKKKQKKSSRDAKAKSQSESLEAGFNAIKEGLMFLGTSMSQQPQVQPAPGATLDDVLIAIKSQSDTMTQLLSHLVAQKGNKDA